MPTARRGPGDLVSNCNPVRPGAAFYQILLSTVERGAKPPLRHTPVPSKRIFHCRRYPAGARLVFAIRFVMRPNMSDFSFAGETLHLPIRLAGSATPDYH